MKKFYYILFILIPTLAFVGCTDENFYEDSSSESPMGKLSYRISLDDEMESRAIGDGLSVNTLKVGIFQDETLISTKEIKRGEDGKFMVNDITLLKNLEYQVVFWAYAENNGIYQIDDDFNLTIDYNKYSNVSLKGTEAFDAFYKLEKVTITGNNQNIDIELIRPFAQLNIAAKEEDVFDNVKKSSFTIDKVPNKINLRTGEAEGEETVDLSFIYSENDITEKQFIKIAEENYYYVASAYLLAPESGTIKLTGELYGDNDETIHNFDFDAVPLKANHRTNIYGEMIQVEELAPWSGGFTEPTDEGLTCEVTVEGANNVLHIDTPEELAYCMKNGYPEGYDAIHICANHNMKNNDYTWKSIKNVPAGIIIDGTSADGILSHSISNVNMSGEVTGIFGDAQVLKVRNLQLKNITLNSTSSTAAGVLAGTVKGNSSFENVIIEGCSVQSGNDAGGMIGYIARTNETDRAETLNVTFQNSQVNNTKIQSNDVEGIFVGKFSGYDNQETLSFDADCKAENTHITNYVSSYIAENQSVWLEEVDSKYNAWLGTETYRRGVVKFDDEQLIPKWDGETNVEPLKDGNTILIHSAFDVAFLQDKSHTAVTFKTNVDLGSKKYNPIKSITSFDGENHTIYNLKVDMEHDLTYGAAFIKYTSGTTVHKNIKFVGANIHNDHNKSIPIPEYGNEEDGGAGNAYAGTLIATVGGTYTVSNIHVEKGVVRAVCKMGGLIGRVGGVMTMENCSVKKYTLENYEANVPNYYNVPPYDIAGLGIVDGLQWWYTQGECGGLIGFIQSTKTTIKGCSVTDTNMNCYGQPDKSVVANVWLATRFNNTPRYTSGQNLLAKANTDIAGRHINQFIGDVVSQRQEGGSNYVVTIEDYEVSGNKYWGKDASNTNDYNHNYDKNKYCEVVGCAYYVGVDIDALSIKKHIMNCAGELTFNARGGDKTTITENVGNGNSIAWKGGSFTDLQTTILFWSPKSEYPAKPPVQ